MANAFRDPRKASSMYPAGQNLATLVRTRNRLHAAMQKSRALEDSLCKSGPRLEAIMKRIPDLEAAFGPMRSHNKLLDDLPENIDKAVAPASAVLKVYDAMHALEESILRDPQGDLVGYISLVSRLEEARSFLSKNCPMAIEWLQEMIDLLDSNNVLDAVHMKRISSQLEALQTLQTNEDDTNLDGGLLSESLDRLEGEFRMILSLESLPLVSPGGLCDRKCDAVSSRRLSAQASRNLNLILRKLSSNGRRQQCLNIYVAARVKVIRSSLKNLPLDYLRIKSGNRLEWKEIEQHIGPWTQHIEVFVKCVCEPEHQLCKEVLENVGYAGWEGTFGKIISDCGFLEFLRFGEAAVKSRDEPQKLFKLLDMFEAMNNLRQSFSKIFAAPGCKDVHQKAKDLLKLIVQGAHDIFLELRQQVEKQRAVQPPIDGSLPKVSSFVLSYVKHLVGDFYRPIITQVLTICESWKDDVSAKKKAEAPLSRAVIGVMNALVMNFQEWANSFKEKEPALFHLFLCSNHWYLAINSRTPGLRALVGEAWIKDQTQQAELHISLYMKEGWGKVIQHLNFPSITTFTGSGAAARDLLRSRLKAFNVAFEELCQKHTKWIVPDAELREKMCVKVVKVIVPAYRTYLQSYGPLLERDGSRSKCSKYTPQNLEKILGSLFQGRSEKFVGANDKIMNGSTAISQPAPVSVDVCM